MGWNYDIPDEVTQGPHSPAFKKFLKNWFYDTHAVTHYELDLTFLDELPGQERDLARDLIRRNLKLMQTHIIEGTSALKDTDAIPILRAMFTEETDDSRRLTIGGALWKLAKDPLFIECLEHGKATGSLGYFGSLKVLWLDDSRSIDFLIDLLPKKDRESAAWRAFKWVAFRPLFRPLLIDIYLGHAHDSQEGVFALSLLNQLEFGRQVAAHPETWKLPSEYRARRHDAAFRQLMTEAVHRWNSEMKNGA